MPNLVKKNWLFDFFLLFFVYHHVSDFSFSLTSFSHMLLLLIFMLFCNSCLYILNIIIFNKERVYKRWFLHKNLLKLQRISQWNSTQTRNSNDKRRSQQNNYKKRAEKEEKMGIYLKCHPYVGLAGLYILRTNFNTKQSDTFGDDIWNETQCFYRDRKLNMAPSLNHSFLFYVFHL